MLQFKNMPLPAVQATACRRESKNLKCSNKIICCVQRLLKKSQLKFNEYADRLTQRNCRNCSTNIPKFFSECSRRSNNYFPQFSDNIIIISMYYTFNKLPCIGFFVFRFFVFYAIYIIYILYLITYYVLQSVRLIGTSNFILYRSTVFE